MEKLRNLVDLLRKRSLGFKTASDKCHAPEDKLALCARADEVDRCVAAIEAVLSTDTACALCGEGPLIVSPRCATCGHTVQGA